jgi:hypothetical protein
MRSRLLSAICSAHQWVLFCFGLVDLGEIQLHFGLSHILSIIALFLHFTLSQYVNGDIDS